MDKGHADIQPTPWLLVIDQGGHASRASVYDADGGIVSVGETAITPLPSTGVYIEYDPDSMLASVTSAIAKATSTIDSGRISRAALATQRSNVICWERHSGKPLSPIISWQDRRAAQWLDTQAQLTTEIHERTGLFMSAHYGASKLRWCRRHIPAVADAARAGRLAWGPMASWLTRQLCREAPFVCDAVNASRTLLWSVVECDWDPDLIRAFDLDDGALPVSVDNHDDFGTIDVHGHPVPLQIVTGDQAAAIFAGGPPDSETAYITVGTGAFILNPCGNAPAIAPDLLSSLVRLDTGTPHFVHEGTVNGAGSALEHYAVQLGRPDYIDHMPQWLQRDMSPPLFLNGFSGLGTPFMRAAFGSRFIGTGDAAARLVAVVESIVFLLITNLQRLLAVNPRISRIAIGGGLSRLDGFCQRLADLGLPVVRTAQTETTSRGLAWLLSPRTAVTDSGQLEDNRVFTPTDNPALRRRFQRWQDGISEALSDDA